MELSLTDKRKFNEILVSYFPYEQPHTPFQKVLTILIYFQEFISMICALLITTHCFLPRFSLSENDSKPIFHGFVGGKLFISLAYLLSKRKDKLHYLIIKISGTSSLFLFRSWVCIPLQIIQYLCDLAYINGKQLRCTNFDSRFCYDAYYYKLLVIEVAKCTIFAGEETKLHCNLYLIFILSAIYWFLVAHDQVYSYRLSKIFFKSGLILCLCCFVLFVADLLSLQYNFQITYLISGTVLSAGLCSFAVLWFFGDFDSFQIKLLAKNHNNLNSSDKQDYLWEAFHCISLNEKKQVEKLKILYENFEQKTFEMKIFLSGNGEVETLKRYIRMVIQRSSQVDKSFTNFQFYYQETSNESLIEKLDQNDFYEYREYHRILSQMGKKDEGKQMKLINENCFQIRSLIFQLLEDMKSFAAYLNQDIIDLAFCDNVAIKLMKTREKILEIAKKEENSNQRNLPSDVIILLNKLKKTILNSPAPQLARREDSVVSNFYDQEEPLLLVSAENGSVGKIVGCNTATLRETLFLREELIGQPSNNLIPEQAREAHSKILEKSIVTFEERKRMFNVLTFIKKKNNFSMIFNFQVNYVIGIDGKKWIVRFIDLEEKQKNSPLFVCNPSGQIVGVNENISSLGLSLDILGKKVNKDVFSYSQSNKKTVCLNNFFQGQILSNKTLSCELINDPDYLHSKGLPRYFIIKVQEQQKKEKEKQEIRIIQPDYQEDDTHQFYFFQGDLTYTNLEVEQELIEINRTQKVLQNNEDLLDQDNDIYEEDINEMIYFNGEIEFRENKKVNEINDCQIHPAFRTIKKEPEQIMMSKSAPFQTFDYFEKNFKSKTFASVGLLITYSVCIFGIIIAIFVVQSQTQQIVNKKLKTLELMILRNKLYIDLEINLAKGYFQEIGSWDGSMQEDELKLFQNIQKVTEEIQSISNKELGILSKQYDLETKFTQFSQNSLQTILRYFQIKLLAIDTEEERIRQSKIISKAILPIYQKVHKDVQGMFDEDIENILKNMNLAFIILGVINILIIVGLFYFISNILNQRQEILEIYANFSEGPLEYYEKLIKSYHTKLLNGEDVSQISIRTNLQVQNRSIEHKRRIIHDFKGCTYRFFMVFTSLVGVFVGFYFVFLDGFEKTEYVNKIKYTLEIYGKEIVDPEKIWMNQIIKRWQSSENLTILVENEGQFQDDITYAKGHYIQQLQEQLELLSKEYYSKEIMKNFDTYNTVDPCTIFQANFSCFDDFNGYILRKMSDLFVVKVRLIDDFYLLTENEKLKKNMLAQLRISKLHEDVLRDVNNEVEKEKYRQYKKIKIQTILRILITLGFLAISIFFFTYRIISTKSVITEPLKRIINLFPVFLINKNPAFHKWYYQQFRQIVY